MLNVIFVVIDFLTVRTGKWVSKTREKRPEGLLLVNNVAFCVDFLFPMFLPIHFIHLFSERINTNILMAIWKFNSILLLYIMLDQ